MDDSAAKMLQDTLSMLYAMETKQARQTIEINMFKPVMARYLMDLVPDDRALTDPEAEFIGRFAGYNDMTFKGYPTSQIRRVFKDQTNNFFSDLCILDNMDHPVDVPISFKRSQTLKRTDMLVSYKMLRSFEVIGEQFAKHVLAEGKTSEIVDKQRAFTNRIAEFLLDNVHDVSGETGPYLSAVTYKVQEREGGVEEVYIYRPALEPEYAVLKEMWNFYDQMHAIVSTVMMDQFDQEPVCDNEYNDYLNSCTACAASSEICENPLVMEPITDQSYDLNIDEYPDCSDNADSDVDMNIMPHIGMGASSITEDF